MLQVQQIQHRPTRATLSVSRKRPHGSGLTRTHSFEWHASCDPKQLTCAEGRPHRLRLTNEGLEMRRFRCPRRRSFRIRKRAETPCRVATLTSPSQLFARCEHACTFNDDRGLRRSPNPNRARGFSEATAHAGEHYRRSAAPAHSLSRLSATGGFNRYPTEPVQVSRALSRSTCF
jgi:hypothetical protein